MDRESFINSWRNREDFFERRKGRDFGRESDYVLLVKMIRKLVPDVKQIIEIGGGDFAFAEYLCANNILKGRPFLSTDIPCNRVKNAKLQSKFFAIEEATALEAQSRHGLPGTLYIATNVFGSLTPQDTEQFFSQACNTNSHIAFIAAGLPVDLPEESRFLNPIYMNNYFSLAARAGMKVNHCIYYLSDSAPGMEFSFATYIMTVSPRDCRV